MKTNIMREIPSCFSWMAFSVLKLLGLLQSPEAGVCSILDAALAPPVSIVIIPNSKNLFQLSNNLDI